MIPLTPAFLIATAQAFKGVRQMRGEHPGQMIELFLEGVGGDGAGRQQPETPWDAAFVYHAGHWSHYDARVDRSFWPLPATSSAQKLGGFAKDNGVLEETPQPGDVFLQFDVMSRGFGLTGIIVSVDRIDERPVGSPWYDCTTIGGNTNEDGEEGGERNAVVIKRRTFYPDAGDRFIRWADLDDRDRAGNPAGECEAA